MSTETLRFHAEHFRAVTRILEEIDVITGRFDLSGRGWSLMPAGAPAEPPEEVLDALDDGLTEEFGPLDLARSDLRWLLRVCDADRIDALVGRRTGIGALDSDLVTSLETGAVAGCRPEASMIACDDGLTEALLARLPTRAGTWVLLHRTTAPAGARCEQAAFFTAEFEARTAAFDLGHGATLTRIGIGGRGWLPPGVWPQVHLL